MLQCSMEQHAPYGKYHIGYVQNTKPLLKTLPQSIYQANECQQNARNIGYSVVKLCNV